MVCCLLVFGMCASALFVVVCLFVRGCRFLLCAVRWWLLFVVCSVLRAGCCRLCWLVLGVRCLSLCVVALCVVVGVVCCLRCVVCCRLLCGDLSSFVVVCRLVSVACCCVG